MRGGLLFYMMYLGSSPERHLTKQKSGGGGGVCVCLCGGGGGDKAARQSTWRA